MKPAISTRFPSIATQVTAEGAVAIKELSSEDAPIFPRFTTVKQHVVIASEAKQSRMLPRRQSGLLRRLRSSQ